EAIVVGERLAASRCSHDERRRIHPGELFRVRPKREFRVAAEEVTQGHVGSMPAWAVSLSSPDRFTGEADGFGRRRIVCQATQPCLEPHESVTRAEIGSSPMTTDAATPFTRLPLFAPLDADGPPAPPSRLKTRT